MTKLYSPHGTPTQDDVARWFRDNYSDRFVFDVNRGQWRVLDKGIWVLDDLSVSAQVVEIALYAHRAHAPKSSRSLGGLGFLSGSLGIAATLMGRDARHFDQDDFLLGLPRGHLDLRTGQVMAADPKAMLTRRAAVMPQPGIPAQFLAFLDQTFKGDQEMIRYMQKMMGYALSGDVSQEEFYFWFGTGGNGKGVLLGILNDVMGEYSISSPYRPFIKDTYEEHETAVARMQGARAVLVSELPKNAAWNEERLKALTGNEGKISARYMRQDYFEFRFTGKIIMAGNNKPSISSVGDAITRRLRLCPFTNQLSDSERDVTLKEKLKTEYPQILTWMAEGTRLYLSEGLAPPQAVTSGSKQYMSDQDVLGQFIDDALVVSKGSKIKMKDLMNEYQHWLSQNGYRPQALTPQSFRAELQAKGMCVEPHKKMLHLHGYCSKPPGIHVSHLKPV